eukprot:456184-Amphidinium_carterae.1
MVLQCIDGQFLWSAAGSFAKLRGFPSVALCGSGLSRKPGAVVRKASCTVVQELELNMVHQHLVRPVGTRRHVEG